MAPRGATILQGIIAGSVRRKRDRVQDRVVAGDGDGRFSRKLASRLRDGFGRHELRRTD